MASLPGTSPYPYDHTFLGQGHEHNERRTWFVIVLCGLMMLVEIVAGILFGSIALVADGLHMSTHAGAPSKGRQFSLRLGKKQGESVRFIGSTWP